MSEILDHLRKKHLDITKKLEIAKNIVQKCLIEKENGCLSVTLKQELNRFKLYTDFYSKDFLNIIKDLREQNKERERFKKDLALHTLDNKIYGCLETYDKVRDFIYNTYIEKRSIPTIDAAATIKEDFFLRNNQSNFNSKLKWTFIRRGFVFRQLPGTSKTIIVERAEQIRRRMEYLHKIRHYRESNKHMLYVVDLKLPSLYFADYIHIEDQFPKFLLTAAFPAEGCIECSMSSNSSYSNNFLRWFVLTIIPRLPESMVIVIEEDRHLTGDVKEPTALSSKQDMVKWLELNEVPHDPDTHRAELFQLVEKSKHKLIKLDKFSELMDSHGHQVLVRPECSSVNYFDAVYSYVTEKLPYEKKFNNKKRVLVRDVAAALNSLSDEKLREFERKLVDVEKKVYDDDMMVEEIVDKLLTMATYGEISEKDLGTYRVELDRIL